MHFKHKNQVIVFFNHVQKHREKMLLQDISWTILSIKIVSLLLFLFTYLWKLSPCRNMWHWLFVSVWKNEAPPTPPGASSAEMLLSLIKQPIRARRNVFPLNRCQYQSCQTLYYATAKSASGGETTYQQGSCLSSIIGGYANKR